MNQVPEERKLALTKTFAIVGFAAIILFAVWLAVQVVSLIPSAFSSLASLADSVYNYSPAQEMKVTTKNSVVNAGERFTINYTTATTDGLYTLSYACTDGAALSVIVDEEQSAVTCDTPMEISDSGATDIVVDSEKRRFIDIPFTITYTGVDGTELTAKNQVTIVNASIPTTVATTAGVETETEVSYGAITEIANINTGFTGEPDSEIVEQTTSSALPIAGTPVTTPEIIYAIPTSDPNGAIDLAIRFLGVGILTDTDVFIPAGVIGLGQTGAFQFEVKNLGTKTSKDWTYSVNMPGDIDYDSIDQKPLKPNERAVITLGFTGLTQTGVESFGAEIDTDEDVLATNDRFVSAVSVVK